MEVPQLQFIDVVVVSVVCSGQFQQSPGQLEGPQISSSTCSWSVSEVGFFARFTGIFRIPSSWTFHGGGGAESLNSQVFCHSNQVPLR